VSLAVLLALWACSPGSTSGASGQVGGDTAATTGDGGAPDGGAADGGGGDGGTPDGGAGDGGSHADGGGTGGGGNDGGTGDGGTADGGAPDGGTADGGALDDRTCVMVSDLARTHFWEGEDVEFSLSCTGWLPTEDALITATSIPAGASLDPRTHHLRWPTGPADGGRVDMIFSVRPAHDDRVIPETFTQTLWVADNPLVPGATPPDWTTYTEEWELPVLDIETSGTLTETYQDVTVWWQGSSLPAHAKVRGASSVYYDKQSYMLEFDKEEPELDAWGHSRDHLVLLTTFDDNSYVRQKLVYDQWAAIADYWGEDRLTPRTMFIVVYIDGAYHGLYVGLDRIDNEFVRHMGFDDSGNLYKSVNHDANFALTGSGGGAKSTLHDGYEKEEGEPADDFSDLDELVYFTGSSSYAQLVADLDDHVITDEFMDWYLLVVYALAEDSAGKNAYLYHDPDSGLFRYAPWDFNHSWGQGWYTYRTDAAYINSFTGTNRIFGAFRNVESTDDALWDRFRELRTDGPYDPAWITAQVDDYYALIDDSAARDWAKWADAYYSYGGWAGYRDAVDDWTDYEGEKAYLYEWLDDRATLFEALVP